MRKILLALLIGSLATIRFGACAELLVADASTNFEPANRPGSAPTAPAPQAPATPTVTSPAPAKPAAKPAAKPVAKPAPAKAAAATAPVGSPAASLSAQEEVVRRQAAQVQARALIDEGEKLYSSGKYDQAVTKLEAGLRLLPRAKVTEADYNRATRLLADSYIGLANAALSVKDFTKARAMAQKALEYDPHNAAAENVIVKIKAEENRAGLEPFMPQSPVFQGKQDDVRKLFREGKLLMNSGQYDEAEKRFQQILIIDPYNTDAYEFLQQVTTDRESSTAAGVEATRRNRLWEAETKWLAPVSGEVKTPELVTTGGALAGSSAGGAEILQKLNDIIFPEIKFREASIIDVIQYLSDESRKLDPKKDGVNIVLGAGIGGGGGELTAPPTLGVEGAPPTALPLTGGGGDVRPITLSLQKVPMIEALKYITSLAGLKYRVESSAVLIVRLDEPEGQMITRTYPISPNVFLSLINVTNRPAATQQSQAVSGGGGGASQAAALTQQGASTILPDVAIYVDSSNQVKQTFIDAGVLFPTNSSVYYYPRNSTIIIHNTIENLETFERVLNVFNTPPQLIEIEAKFVEIGQADLDELGFKWKVGPYQSGDVVISGGQPGTIFPGSAPNPNANGNDITAGLRDSTLISGNAVDALLGGGIIPSGGNTIGSIRGILTNPQFQVIINAISRKTGADLLSAPKVTTLSGSQAQIRVAQEFIYPTTYSTATIQPGQSGVNGTQPIVTPSTPTAFASRPVGVVFNVTPTVGPDGYTIGLTLIPSITDFLGFINYGSPITSSSGIGQTVTTPNDIKQPLFSVRDVVTSVVIWDGQTVVLGGLIREDVTKIDDKVPFLGDLPFAGRLFRSKVTSRTKRNLLIFVTARLIDPAGNPIHRETAQANLR